MMVIIMNNNNKSINLEKSNCVDIKGNKVIINKITYTDFGFTYDIPNGYILGHENEKPLVKTPNGVIILEDYKTDFKIHKGDIFE